MEEAAVNRLATSITRLTLSQVTTDEIDAATKLLDKACQKLRGISDVPPQRITDFETAIRQLRQLSCILDSCTIAASYEVSQAQTARLLMPRPARVASTSSDEENAQVSLLTDDEYRPSQSRPVPRTLAQWKLENVIHPRRSPSCTNVLPTLYDDWKNTTEWRI
jgi:hypothetical protein